jgi:hypothetical protein
MPSSFSSKSIILNDLEPEFLCEVQGDWRDEVCNANPSTKKTPFFVDSLHSISKSSVQKTFAKFIALDTSNSTRMNFLD